MSEILQESAQTTLCYWKNLEKRYEVGADRRQSTFAVRHLLCSSWTWTAVKNCSLHQKNIKLTQSRIYRGQPGGDEAETPNKIIQRSRDRHNR